MTIRRFALRSPTARASTGLALLALAGIGISMANTEAVVASRFAAALEAAPAQRIADRAADRALVSGSEAYWLTQKRRHDTGAAIEPAAWSAAPFTGDLSIGDRITISGTKGDRILEVVAISEIEPLPGAAHAGDRPDARKLGVTCRDVSAPDGRLVTFEIPAEMAPGVIKSARAL